MTIKLKPCPFCGGKAVICEDGELSLAYKVFCLNPACDAQYGWCVSEEEVINGWNRRKGGEDDEHTD